MNRQPPPPLQLVYPPCPMCDRELDYDGDGWACYPCDAFWPPLIDEETPGEWGHPTPSSQEAL